MSAMPSILGGGRDRRQLVIGLFCAMLLLAWCVLVFYHVRAQHGHVLGDWLLDYRQGFVRRGLIGSILSGLANVTRLPVTVWVALAQIAQFAIFLYCLLRVLAGRFKPFWYVLLMLSPATLLFSFFEVSGVGRKETLYFALLAWFVLGLDRERLSVLQTVVWTVTSVAITLSHELILFYAPYYLIAAIGVAKAQRAQALRAAGSMVLGSWMAGAAVLLLAKPLDGPAFCDSLMQSGLSSTVCQGIVLWKLQDLRSSFDETLLTIRYFGYLKTYAMALVLSLVPVFVWLRRYRPGKVRLHLRWMVAAWAWSSLAFLLAVDWGRLIQIHLVSGLVVLALRLRRRDAPALAAPSVPRFHAPSAKVRWGLAILCMLAPIFWHMPTCCESGIGGGVAGKAERGVVAIMRLAGL